MSATRARRSSAASTRGSSGNRRAGTPRPCAPTRPTQPTRTRPSDAACPLSPEHDDDADWNPRVGADGREARDAPRATRTRRGLQLRAQPEEARDAGERFVKYTHPAKQGRDRRVKEKLGDGHTVRDAKGREDAKKIKAIDRVVEKLAHALLSGKLAVPEERPDKPLTLLEGFARVLDLATGKYPTKTRRYGEVDRARRKLERILGKQRSSADRAFRSRPQRVRAEC